MTGDSAPVLVLILWLAALGLLVAKAWRGGQPVAGLAIAYWFQLWLIHWIGGAIYVLSNFSSHDRTVALIGFTETGYAIAGLLIGNVLLAPFLFRPQTAPERVTQTIDSSGPGFMYVIIGLGLYFVTSRLLPKIPGTDAIISSGFRLAIAGFCLWWLARWQAGQKGRSWIVLASAALVPFFTVSLDGFMGYGVFFLMCLACFVSVYYRPRWHLLVVAPAALLVGMSLYPAYLSVRTSLRHAVWGGASYSERLEKMALIAGEYQWFDPDNPAHLRAIDMRLNQNILVGHAVNYLEAGGTEYGEGETLVNAMLAFIPRVLWPGKPQYAGSGGLVTRYTGIQFARGTSVGIGQVMELYVNFGGLGVLIGFTILGLLLGFFDLQAGMALRAGQWKQFALWFAVGLSFLQVGGNFAEATSAAAGSAVLCLLVNSFLGRQKETKQAPHPKVPQIKMAHGAALHGLFRDEHG